MGWPDPTINKSAGHTFLWISPIADLSANLTKSTMNQPPNVGNIQFPTDQLDIRQSPSLAKWPDDTSSGLDPLYTDWPESIALSTDQPRWYLTHSVWADQINKKPTINRSAGYTS